MLHARATRFLPPAPLVICPRVTPHTGAPPAIPGADAGKQRVLVTLTVRGEATSFVSAKQFLLGF